MKFIRSLLLLLFIPLLLLCGILHAQIPENLAEVSLSSEFKSVKLGDSGWLLIEVEVVPDWHMYWKNAGQSGYPTTIEWESEDAEIGSLEFPTPKAYDFWK